MVFVDTTYDIICKRMISGFHGYDDDREGNISYHIKKGFHERALGKVKEEKCV